MAQNIEPYRQTVQACLKDKTYYIDFYQREYVWSDETVKILLDDIFVLGLYREGAAYVYLYYLQEAQS